MPSCWLCVVCEIFPIRSVGATPSRGCWSSNLNTYWLNFCIKGFVVMDGSAIEKLFFVRIKKILFLSEKIEFEQTKKWVIFVLWRGIFDLFNHSDIYIYSLRVNHSCCRVTPTSRQRYFRSSGAPSKFNDKRPPLKIKPSPA